MTVIDSATGTNVHEIADGIYRINTPVEIPGTAFSFNQYLVAGDEPLLFHTGPRQLFPQVQAAVAHVLPLDGLRHVAFSHVEADECGSLNQWLAVAPHAAPLCGSVAAMVSIGDLADRPPRVLADGETVDLGGRRFRWMDAPHVPHGWECGYLFEETTRTLFCGDLFTQPGTGATPLTEGDILTPSQEFRRVMDYYALGPNTGAVLDRLADTGPETLACMHGSAWQGNGGALLRELAGALAP
ncbi:MAG: MBL fold metallo-hydrolase [Alphaproteobacteria bacterium]|nr:MBL fold metallo-hydrolase [Alphaproteobacteria bacterium]